MCRSARVQCPSLRLWGQILLQVLDGFCFQRFVVICSLYFPSSSFFVTSVAVGANHACAVDDVVGGVYCWGNNFHCQLGYQASCAMSSSNLRQENPVRAQQQLAQKIAAVTVGNAYTCAITIGRALYCWGDNRFGFLGNSSAPLAVVPTPVLVNLNAVREPSF